MGRARNPLPIELDDQIPHLDAGQLRRCPGRNLPHEHRACHGAVSGRRFVRAEPQVAAVNESVGEDLVADPPGGVARNRESDPLGVRAGDRRRDPHDAAMDVNERPAGIARIDRGIGLEKVAEAVPHHPAPAQGADDAVGQRPVEAVGVADRPHHLPHLEAVAVAPGRRRQSRGVDPQDGKIGLVVRPGERGHESAAIGEGDLDRVGVVDAVVVGDDDAIGGDDHP